MLKIDELAANIDAQMQQEFKRFVQTGEASDGFLAYLERDGRAQEAVERAFDAQAEALGGLAKAIKDNRLGGSSQDTFDPAVQIATAIEQAAEIPEDRRPDVLMHVAVNVTEMAGPAGVKRVRSTLTELQEALSSVVGAGNK